MALLIRLLAGSFDLVHY